MTRAKTPAIPKPVELNLRLETSIKITVRIPPGEWIMGVWSIVQVQFEIFRDNNTDQWFTHVCYGNFKAVRKPLSNRGYPQAGAHYGKSEVFPGFYPRIDRVPLKVIDAVRVLYESHGVSPQFLPPPDVAKGKGPVR